MNVFLIQVFGKNSILLFLNSMENEDQPERVSRHKKTKSRTSCIYNRTEVNKLECSTCEYAVIPAGQTFGNSSKFQGAEFCFIVQYLLLIVPRKEIILN